MHRYRLSTHSETGLRQLFMLELDKRLDGAQRAAGHQNIEEKVDLYLKRRANLYNLGKALGPFYFAEREAISSHAASLHAERTSPAGSRGRRGRLSGLPSLSCCGLQLPAISECDRWLCVLRVGGPHDSWHARAKTGGFAVGGRGANAPRPGRRAALAACARRGDAAGAGPWLFCAWLGVTSVRGSGADE